MRQKSPSCGQSAWGAAPSRLRSNPSNLSGSCQRREPPRDRPLTRISPTANVAIIGAGVIGLGIAWRLAQRGAAVTVFDKGAAGAGASHAAAGMLAACCRSRAGRGRLVALGRASQARGRISRASLQRRPGSTSDLRTRRHARGRAHRRRSGAAHTIFSRSSSSLGLPLEWLSARRDAAARAASRRQARRRDVEPGRSSGR